jgi:hypothetical protein
MEAKMNFCNEYDDLIKKLYAESGPVIRYRIDSEFYKKTNLKTGDYFNKDTEPIKYWLNAWDGKTIHGGKDEALENCLAKLLEFGCTKNEAFFKEKFGFLTNDKYWEESKSFAPVINQIVIYPFMIRAGYYADRNISSFFEKRLVLIERTIEKYGYDFLETSQKKSGKMENKRIFKFYATEALPSIYDFYAFAFYPKNDDKINKRIDKIIKYIMDERFQKIPDNTSVYDDTVKRYYALGSVYHACFLSYRKLLNIYLLSHFRASVDSIYFTKELDMLLNTRQTDGFFEFDKSLLIEKKNLYYIYNGGHMGLGEPAKDKSSRKKESTFWMLKILYNMEKVK